MDARSHVAAFLSMSTSLAYRPVRQLAYPIALAFVAALPATSVGQDAATLERRVDSLFSDFTKGVSPGAAVVVIRDGQVVFRKGYGYADLEHRVPITTSSVFDIASVSKQFTGLAVSMLVEQGKIGLKDDIRKYIPELYAFDPPITIEHLLHHTSGLRDWPGMLTLAGWNAGDVISFDHILRFAFAQKTRNFASGAEHTYSNTNYNLLAETVARVTGKSFRAWTDSNIFAPLGMRASHFRVDVGEVFANRVWSYGRARDSSWAILSNGLLAQGSSSLFTSADDLAKWLMNFSTHTVGGNSAVDRMLEHTKLNDGTEVKYGFGVSVDDWRGLRMITHNGGWAGFSTFVVWFPQIRGGVVMLANTPVNPDALGLAVSSTFFASHLAPQTTTQASQAAQVGVATALLDEYAGVYKLGPGWYVRIRREGNELRTQATMEPEYPMVAVSPTEFRVPGYGNRTMTFVRDSARRISSLSYQGTPGRASPRASSTERPLLLNDYLGDYESDELSVRYNVFVRDGNLMIGSFRRGSFRLTRAFGDDFRSQTIAVEFQRDASGRITGFIANAGERNRNIKFAKR
jgi:CubicO group peptidase (beta-lactamase class C family)